MRRIFLFLAVTMALVTSLNAQVRTGVKGGISTLDITAPALTITDEATSPLYRLSVDKTKIGVHLGFFVQAEIGMFFIQPELLFNSQSVDYKFEGLQPELNVEIRDETYQSLDFPITVGMKFGPVRIGGGMTGHLFLNSNSDIDDLFATDYEASFQTLTWGWHAGLGVDVWKLHLDARYEGLLDNWGGHMNYFGKQYEFDGKPTRIVVSIGISF